MSGSSACFCSPKGACFVAGSFLLGGATGVDQPGHGPSAAPTQHEGSPDLSCLSTKTGAHQCLGTSRGTPACTSARGGSAGVYSALHFGRLAGRQGETWSTGRGMDQRSAVGFLLGIF